MSFLGGVICLFLEHEWEGDRCTTCGKTRNVGREEAARKQFTRLFPVGWLLFGGLIFAVQVSVLASIIRADVPIWPFLDTSMAKFALSSLFFAMALTLFAVDLPVLPDQQVALMDPHQSEFWRQWDEHRVFSTFVSMAAHLVLAGTVLAIACASFLLWGILGLGEAPLADNAFISSTAVGKWLVVGACALPFLAMCISIANVPVTCEAKTAITEEHGWLHGFLYFWGGLSFVAATGLFAVLVMITARVASA